jgi:hypothetical protein
LIGGPGRTRTCNQTVMSGLDQQNALVLSEVFTSIICDLLRSFTFMRDPTGTPTRPEEQRRTADSIIIADMTGLAIAATRSRSRED